MLVGATGSGKSTLIDGFANYLFEVNWEDEFRFTLLNLEKEERKRLTDQVQISLYFLVLIQGQKRKKNPLISSNAQIHIGVFTDSNLCADILKLFGKSIQT